MGGNGRKRRAPKFICPLGTYMYVAHRLRPSPMLLDTFPGPHVEPPLDIFLQYRVVGVEPPRPLVSCQGCGRTVLEELLVELMPIECIQRQHETLELHTHRHNRGDGHNDRFVQWRNTFPGYW